LPPVPGEDQGTPAVDAADGVGRADLAGLVHNDDIEVQAGRQVLADRRRGHQEARLDRLADVAGPLDENTDRQVAPLLFRFLADDGRLAGVAARAPRVARADDVPVRRGKQGPVQLLVLPDQRRPVRLPNRARAGSVLR
jgi:hypothetical protein